MASEEQKAGGGEALRELLAKWRERVETAPKSFAGPHRPAGSMNRFERRMLSWCADELEEALAAAPSEPLSHPPQDGQRSYLADSDNLKVGRAPKIAWMDSIAFDHELGDRPTNKIHATEIACRAAHPCIEVCEKTLTGDYPCRAMRVYVFDADAYDATKPNPTPTIGPQEAVVKDVAHAEVVEQASAPVAEKKQPSEVGESRKDGQDDILAALGDAMAERGLSLYWNMNRMDESAKALLDRVVEAALVAPQREAAASAPVGEPQDFNAKFGGDIFVVTGEHQRTAFFSKAAAERYLAKQNPERFKIVVYAKPVAEREVGEGLRELATYLLNTSAPDWEYDKVLTMAAESLAALAASAPKPAPPAEPNFAPHLDDKGNPIVCAICHDDIPLCEPGFHTNGDIDKEPTEYYHETCSYQRTIRKLIAEVQTLRRAAERGREHKPQGGDS